MRSLATQQQVDIRQFARLLRHTEAPFAGKPFVPEPWQDEYLDRLFNTKRPDGLRQYQRSLLALPRKSGKALALDTPVLTVSGWKTMGTVEIGDEVFHPRGHATRVVAVSDVMTGRPCYEVAFTQGDTIVADEDHLWLTNARVDRPGDGSGNHGTGKAGWRVRTTAEIARSCLSGLRFDRNHSVQVAEPLEMPAASLPLDPYLLGAWLGDGATSSARVTVGLHEDEMLENIRQIIPGAPARQYGAGKALTVALGGVSIRKKNRGLGVRPVAKLLRDIGVLGNKHIPSQYMRASREQRLALLQGMMDTDGSISRNQGQAEFVSTNRRLAEDFAELATTLGLKASLREGAARLNGRVVGLKYRVTFTPLLPMKVFRLSRKQARVKPPPASSPRCRTRQIASCTKTDSVPVRCIQVASQDGMFLVGRSLIPTHNSAMCAVIGAYEGFFGAEGGQILIAAGDRKQASLLFTACSRYIESCPGLLRRCKIFKGSIVIPHKNSTIQFLSSEHKGKHGFNPSLCLVDEFHVQRNRDLIDVLESGMGARAEPLVVYITTAGMDRVGPCYDEWQRALKIQDGILHDPTFLPCIYAAPDSADPFLEDTWRVASPNYGVTIRKEFMEREAALAKEAVAQEIKFRTLYLNQWVSNGANKFFRTGQFEACGTELRPTDGRPCWCGLDLASTSDTTAFVAVWPDEGGGYDVFAHLFIPEENADKAEAPYRQWAKDGFVTLTEGNITDYDVVRDYVLSFCERTRVRSIAIDRWNATHLTTQLVMEGVDVKPYGQGYASMSAPTKLLETLVLGQKLRHGGNPPLCLHVSNMQVKQDDAGNLKPTKSQSHSTARIDAAVALIMALGIASSEAHGPEEEPQILLI
jgi:phage terminase large subunit-like protein